MTKRIFLSFSLLLSFIFTHAQNVEQQSVDEFNSNKVAKYSTKGEEKCKGLDLNIKYPSSWKSLEGERPHAVRKFVQSRNFVLAMILINTQKSNFTQTEIDNSLSKSGLISQLPLNSTYISSNSNLKIDGLKAGSIEYNNSTQKEDRKYYSKLFTYVFFYKKYFINLQFMIINKIDEPIETLTKRYNALKPLFSLMFNTIVIKPRL